MCPEHLLEISQAGFCRHPVLIWPVVGPAVSAARDKLTFLLPPVIRLPHIVSVAYIIH